MLVQLRMFGYYVRAVLSQPLLFPVYTLDAPAYERSLFPHDSRYTLHPMESPEIRDRDHRLHNMRTRCMACNA